MSGFVRKCMGKNKQAECLQLGDHNNTRWECAFESQNKDEYTKHCKNIAKRLKWRELGNVTLYLLSFLSSSTCYISCYWLFGIIVIVIVIVFWILVENNKPDKDGWYRCVYYSTDKHHVENHFHKGNNVSYHYTKSIHPMSIESFMNWSGEHPYLYSYLSLSALLIIFI